MERCCRCHRDVNVNEIKVFIGSKRPLPVCPECAKKIEEVLNVKFPEVEDNE